MRTSLFALLDFTQVCLRSVRKRSQLSLLTKEWSFKVIYRNYAENCDEKGQMSIDQWLTVTILTESWSMF